MIPRHLLAPRHPKSFMTTVALSFMIVLGGCGAILYGGKQDVTFDSKPPGAAVKLDHDIRFMTPHTVSLPRSQNHHATFEKEGYEPLYVTINHEFQVLTSFVGNLLPFFPVGLAIDIVTGAAWRLEPELVRIELIKKKKP